MLPADSKRAMTRCVWTVAFVLWLCCVWGHSLVPGPASSDESSRFVFLVRPLFALFGNSDEQLMTFIIRKTAHFSEYAILALIGRRMAVAWLGRTHAAQFLSAAIWVVVPCIDECIQLFVPGRDGRITDVLIDMAGGLLGLYVARLLERRLPPATCTCGNSGGE